MTVSIKKVAIGITSIILLILSYYSVSEVSDVEGTLGGGSNLPHDAEMKIMIDKRIGVDDCPVKSKEGDVLYVHYVLKLYSTNKVIQSTRESKPFVFVSGNGGTLEGFDTGTQGMCVGEQRTLIIPSDLAYGDDDDDDEIPPGSTLVFEIELVRIRGEGEEGSGDESEDDEEDVY